ncbi:phosphate uptake regulator PhoU [Candidatus Woesearchaeota archaeon]|nr:phosphate uptake regulator PhoU [Candidatus Woesearchaeota archaeon]
MVEFRKLISFGKTSFVISIPKSWIMNNKLKKGDLISIDENNGNLVLSTKTTETPPEIKEITIDITNKNIIQIKREIIKYYVDNFNVIKIMGNDLKIKAREIRDILQNLIALEIMEQTGHKILVRDFTNMDKISIPNLIRRIDIITRAMLIDARDTLKEDHYESIKHRDDDVNRLTFLVFRAVRFALDNPSAFKVYNMDTFNLLKHWNIALNLEKIADGCKRISKNFRRMKLSPSFTKQLNDLTSEVEKKYIITMKAYHNKDLELIFKVSDGTRPLLEKFNKFGDKNRDKFLVENTTENLKQMIVHINDIARALWL